MARKRRTKDRPRREPVAEATSTKGESQDSIPQEFFHQFGLKVLVFTAGAVLMALEIAGSRVLAPHFGNSVFIWGSLISVFLMALSLGYFLGGRLADRYPSRMLLNSICVGVSLLIFGIAVFAHRVCGAFWAGGFGEQSGPLLASMVLFLPPSVGMGMVSPFAIRLATSSVSSVGKISGTLYALSTLGSIVGTLLTTFLLIPLLGLALILKSLGLVLLLASVCTYPFWTNRQSLAGAAALTMVTLTCLFWPVPSRANLARGERLVLDADTPYHHIAVIDNRIPAINSRGERTWKNTRELRFDRYTESEIELPPSDWDRKEPWPYPSEARYTNYFHLAWLARPEMKRVLFIGAGGGVGPRAFHMHDPEMEIDVVDIDPKVLELARTHFFLEDTPKIRTFAQDGRMFVRGTDEKYDCVILDAFSIGGRIPFHLVTKEFLEQCSEKMTDEGVFLMNTITAVDGRLSGIFRSMYRTTKSVFPNTYVFVRGRSYGQLEVVRNVIFVATKGGEPIPADQWIAAAEKHETDSYVTSDELKFMVDDLLVDPPDVSDAPLFTDDYAPIETMPFELPRS